jgi:hypothetical protein
VKIVGLSSRCCLGVAESGAKLVTVWLYAEVGATQETPGSHDASQPAAACPVARISKPVEALPVQCDAATLSAMELSFRSQS